MSIRRAAVAAILVSCASLNACINLDCDDCDPPPEAVSEMNLSGATLTPLATPFPQSVNADYVVLGVEHSVTADLYLYFAPAQGRETIENPNVLVDRSRFPYEMRYTEQMGANFIEIPPTLDFDVQDPEAIYSGEIDFRIEPVSLLGSANHVLAAPQPFEAPVRATHVELWIRDSPDANAVPALVRRIELRSLAAWQRYLQPVIDEWREPQ